MLTTISERSKAWLAQPADRRRRSLRGLPREIPIRAMSTLAKPLFAKGLVDNRLSRRIAFDSASNYHAFLSPGQSEQFLVSGSDKAIGRSTFVDGQAFDSEKLMLVSSLLPEGHSRSILVDVGANIGTISIPAITRGVFKSAIAYEPEPNNFRLLMANLYLNDIAESVEPHMLAVGDGAAASLMFELSKTNLGDHRVHFSGQELDAYRESTREVIEVPVVSLDNQESKFSKDDSVLWIDVQGFEGFVLAGATQALSSRVPLCVEFWPYGMRRSGGYELMRDSIVSAGYETFYDLRHPTTAHRVGVDSFDQLFRDLDNGSDTDLLVL